MKKFRYPLATSSWDNREYEAMQRVIESNIFTMGENVKIFEEQFAKYIGSKYCVMANSGSSANLLMIAGLFFHSVFRLKPGDEVIVPAVSWSTTYYPLFQYGLKIKFVDIDLQTLNFNLEELERAINKNTKLIFAVNVLGNPNNFFEIKKLLHNKNIILIEDNCESMGAEYESKKTGTFGLCGSFSTFYSHHISTMEGGLIVTDDEELYQIILSLRAHGWTRDLPSINKLTGKKSDDSFEESFKFILPGYNLRPLEMSGAIGIEQLKKLPLIIENRRKNGRYFVDLFENNADLIIQKELGKSSWFGFSIVLKDRNTSLKKELFKRLKENGFEIRPIVSGNFANQPVTEFMNIQNTSNLENADHIDNYGFFIGNHHYLCYEDFNDFKKILTSV